MLCELSVAVDEHGDLAVTVRNTRLEALQGLQVPIRVEVIHREVSLEATKYIEQRSRILVDDLQAQVDVC